MGCGWGGGVGWMDEGLRNWKKCCMLTSFISSDLVGGGWDLRILDNGFISVQSVG